MIESGSRRGKITRNDFGRENNNKNNYWKVLIFGTFGIFVMVAFFVLATPVLSNIVLNSTLGTNLTTENLTIYTDQDGNSSVKMVYDWRISNSSFAVLNVPFEQGSNSTWTRDYSSNGNNGTVTNAVWNSSGGFDSFGAYQFDGNGDYIDFGDNSVFEPSNNFSVVFWIKFSSTDNMGILGKDDGTDPYGYKLGYNSGNLSLVLDVSDENGWNYNGYSFTPVLNRWYHVAGVYNTTHKIIYVNGSKVSFSPVTGQLENEVTNSFLVGDTNFDSSFNGSIDDFSFYNRILSDDQITNLYNNQTNLISSEETGVGDSWNSLVVPIDSSGKGLISFTDYLSVLGSSLTLNSPGNLAVFSPDSQINFSCSAIDTSSLVNISLWSNFSGSWDINNTTDISGVSNSSSFVISGLSIGTYGWGCKSYNEDGGSITSTNRTFSILLTNNTFLCFGDSITAGSSPADTTPYCNYTATYLSNSGYSGISPDVQGVGSSTTALYAGNGVTDGIERYDTDIISRNPHFFVMQYGVNDNFYGINKTSFRDAYREIINYSQGNLSNTEIVLMTLTPSSRSEKPENETCHSNEVIQQAAIDFGLKVNHVHYLFDHDLSNFPDGTHPNSTGHQLIAQELNSTIHSGKNQSSSNWDFYFDCNETMNIEGYSFNASNLAFTYNGDADWVLVNNVTINNFSINSPVEVNITSSARYNSSTTYDIKRKYLDNETWINITSDSDTLGKLSLLVPPGNYTYFISETDTTSPTLSILYPTATTYSTNVTTLNFTASDETALSYCWYSTDGGTTNSSLTDCSANFSNMNSTVSGSNTWFVYVNDSSNNMNVSSVSFTYTAPSSSTSTNTGSTSSPRTNSGGGSSSTFVYSSDDVKSGFSRILKKDQAVKTEIKSSDKIINIESVDSEKAVVEIDGKSYSVEVDSSTKVDLDNDGVYDLEISNSGSSTTGLGDFANLEFKEISEEVESEKEDEQKENVFDKIFNSGDGAEGDKEKKISFWQHLINFLKEFWERGKRF